MISRKRKVKPHWVMQLKLEGVAPQRLEFRQVLHRTLAALTGEFKPMVLVNPRGALGVDAERANQAQSLDQLWKIARRRCISGLP
jgi:hypothetical protein